MMARIHHNLPDDFNPADDICYPLVIPKDDQWIAVLLDLLEDPLLHRYWLPEPDRLTEDMRAAYFDRVYTPLIEAILTDTYCQDVGDTELGSCYRMDTTTEAFSYYPNDPFSGEVFAEAIGSGTKFTRWNDAERDAHPIWELVENLITGASGYRNTDVLVTLDIDFWTRNIIKTVQDFLGFFSKFQLPYVLIEFEGTGQLEVELVNFPYGGSALLVPDFNSSLEALLDLVIDILDGGALPQAWLLAELDRDVLSIPPELVATQVQEFEFTQSGSHTMHVVFIPSFQLEPPFFRPFGGIREIEACSEIEIIGSQTGLLYDENRAASDTANRKGVIGMTTVEDICKGVECGMLAYHARAQVGDPAIISGGIQIIEEDGQLVTSIRSAIDSTGVSPVSASIQAQQYGGAIIARDEVNDIVDQIIAANTAGASVAQTVAVLLAQFDLRETELTNYVTAVYEDIVATVTVFNTWTDLEDVFFCKGINDKALGKFISDNAAFGDTMDTALLLPKAIEQQQFETWEARGLNSPATGYATTPCYRQPDRSALITPDMLFTGATSAIYIDDLFVEHGAKPASNRWQIVTSGYFEHTPTGSIHDLWFLDGASQQMEMKRANISQHIGIPDPLYNTNYVYEAYFADPQSFDHDGIYYGSRPAWNAVDVQAKFANGADATGVSITLKDLGVP